MKEEVNIHSVRANAAVPAPAESFLVIWQVRFTMSRSVQEWVNDCVWPLCLIQARSISGIWPVYFAAICSTSQHRKDSVCHSPSPVAWPQLKKKCQEMFSWISYTADVMGKRCECRENVEAKQDIANFPDQVCYDILFKNKTKKC